MERWEYETRTLVDNSMWDYDLNDLGAQGWELVSHSITAPNSSYTSIRHYYTFKRRVDSSPIGNFGPK